MSLVFSGDLKSPGAERELELCASLVDPRKPARVRKLQTEARARVLAKAPSQAKGPAKFIDDPENRPRGLVGSSVGKATSIVSKQSQFAATAKKQKPTVLRGFDRAVFLALLGHVHTAMTAHLPQLYDVGATGKDVLNNVCERNGVTLAMLRGKSRARLLCDLRQEAMYLMRVHTLLCTPQIGKLLDRDHTTVLHGSEAHALRNNLPMPWKRDGRAKA